MQIIKSMESFRARFSAGFLVFMIVGFCLILVKSDFAQDKKECQDQLVGLSPCIPFISEEVKSPSPFCCLKLGVDFDQKRRCMCMLVRDRNEPGVGFKINAKLALSLPFICHIPANETQCLDFLHLDPKSPDAQVFLQFSNVSGSSNTTTSKGDSESSNSSLNPSLSSSEHIKGWLNLVMVGGVSVWLFISDLKNNL